MKLKEVSKRASVPAPPITKKVTLPGVVAVRFLIDVSGQEPETVTGLMNNLHILVDINRSIDFAAAQKILRQFGILAEREPFTGLTI